MARSIPKRSARTAEYFEGLPSHDEVGSDGRVVIVTECPPAPARGIEHCYTAEPRERHAGSGAVLLWPPARRRPCGHADCTCGRCDAPVTLHYSTYQRGRPDEPEYYLRSASWREPVAVDARDAWKRLDRQLRSTGFHRVWIASPDPIIRSGHWETRRGASRDDRRRAWKALQRQLTLARLFGESEDIDGAKRSDGRRLRRDTAGGRAQRRRILVRP